MRELVDFFRKKGIVFEKFTKLDLKKLGIKKRLEIYIGLDTHKKYYVIVYVDRKSRILLKDAKSYEELVQSLPVKHGFRYKYLLYHAPLCSKAKEYLQEVGWRVDAIV
ncbi:MULTISPECIES: hypothetical protein [unclassified Nitratiruptor]|uniref:hypothetical protein n=1 Tax=unclassified Nitratiruptor TaxID=2624044 RepID=UPI0019159516|nr:MULTISPECIES: hypothetical protein [unclassified Nitratiruptor]